MQTKNNTALAEAAAKNNLYVVYNNSISKRHLDNKFDPLEIFGNKYGKSADEKSALPSFEEWLKRWFVAGDRNSKGNYLCPCCGVYNLNISTLRQSSTVDKVIVKCLNKCSVNDILEMWEMEESDLFVSSSVHEKKSNNNYEDKILWIHEKFDKDGNMSKRDLIPGILAEHLRDTQPVFSCSGRIYAYENGVYKIANKEALRKIVSNHIPVEIRRDAGIRDVTNQWVTLIDKNQMPEHDSSPYIINFKNGLYDVLGGEFKSHTPNYISLVQLPVNFNPDAKCPVFQNEYLAATQKGYEDNTLALQEWGGYAMSWLTQAQKFLLLIGVPHAGKGVFLRVLNKILGIENISAIPAHQLADEFKVIELMGKIANTCGDIPAKRIPEGKIKEFVGEDLMTGRFKGRGEEKFYNKAKIIFSGQTAPDTADPTDGFYRRVCIIPFKNSVQADKTLEGRLQEELEGIAYFFIKGLKRLIENNFEFTVSESMKEAMEQYKMESNTIVEFVTEMAEFGEGYWVDRADLYKAYTDFVWRVHGVEFRQCMKPKEFNSTIKSNYVKKGVLKKDGFKDENRKSHRVWMGLKLK
jgi:P4 family phage/plasmid primase-like protien